MVNSIQNERVTGLLDGTVTTAGTTGLYAHRKVQRFRFPLAAFPPTPFAPVGRPAAREEAGEAAYVHVADTRAAVEVHGEIAVERSSRQQSRLAGGDAVIASTIEAEPLHADEVAKGWHPMTSSATLYGSWRVIWESPVRDRSYLC